MKTSQPILELQSRWPQENGYCFELRRRRVPQQTKGGAPPPATSADHSDRTDHGDRTDNERIQSLEQDKVDLQRQLDSTKLQLQGKENLEEKVKNLQEANIDLTTKLQTLQQTQQTSFSELQNKLDTLSLEKQQLEDQVLVLKAAATSSEGEKSDESRDPIKLLEQVQSQYGKEIRSLTNQLREKERLQEDMNAKFSEMVTCQMMKACGPSWLIIYLFP